MRVDAKPAFTLGRSSPHPRIPEGPFEVVWTGAILLREPGPITFHVIAGGDVSLAIDGVEVLRGQAKTGDAELRGQRGLERGPGLYALRLRFRSLPDVPARVQLWWQGPTFAAEPIPAWRFRHVASERSPRAKDEATAAVGKASRGAAWLRAVSSERTAGCR